MIGTHESRRKKMDEGDRKDYCREVYCKDCKWSKHIVLIDSCRVGYGRNVEFGHTMHKDKAYCGYYKRKWWKFWRAK
jgi:hypothetical protein